MAEFRIKQGATSPSIVRTLKDTSGNPLDLTNATVEFRMATTTYRPFLRRQCTVIDAEGGRVRLDWNAGDTKEAATYLGEWAVRRAGATDIIPPDGYDQITVVKSLAN